MEYSEQHKCCCCSLRALNIADYEDRCRTYLAREAPNIRWALMSLELLAGECKVLVDNNAVEYDTYPLFQFLKDLPTALPFETETINILTKWKYLYFKRKLIVILKENLFNEYIAHVRKNLKLCLGDTKNTEVVLRKFLKVCHLLRLQPELTTDEVHHYEFMADLLMVCYEENVQDSRLVNDLLKLTIDRYMIELSATRHLIRQPLYPCGFFKYVLQLTAKERFDLGEYCRDRPRSLWEYSRNFSVINAVSFGNVDRTLALLQFGFEVFSEREARNSGHGFPFIGETMPPIHRMILKMMSSMRSMNLFILNSIHISDNRLYTVTENQNECFRLVWRAIPDPYVKYAEIGLAISTEYFHLARNAILNPMRYEKNTKFCIMYELCFMDMAAGPKQPRSLKHLSRCTLRSSLKESLSLPDGTLELGLPKALERYMNLEMD